MFFVQLPLHLFFLGVRKMVHVSIF